MGQERDAAPRMAGVAPRLTRMYEFEDKQLEAEYKRDEMRHELECRTSHIAVGTALFASTGAVMNWVVGADDFVMSAFALAYAGCWLAYAGYARLAESRGVPLARVENLFVVIFVCSHSCAILLCGGLRSDIPSLCGGEISSIGHSAIPKYQLFIASLTAAYAQLDVRHCTVIACAGTLVVALNRVRLPAHCYAQSLPPLTVGWLLFCHLPGPHVHARFPTALSKRDHRASLSCRRSRRTRGGDGLCECLPQLPALARTFPLLASHRP
ncbi:hypothetical protein T492DRAFT_997821 [Pavlovales sp. CCMP2436]|nr:hypothetical protein T492DRAFT_997821 [Pavlovales sp. CCMP2436]